MIKYNTRFFSGILLILFFFAGCSNHYQEDFDKALNRAVKNNDVKEAQWKSLLKILDTAVDNGVTLTQDVSTKEELIQYIWEHYPDINGSVTDLVRKVTRLDTLNIYLENSVSMKGYFPKGGNLKFAEPIIGLYNLGGESAAIQTLLVGNDILKKDPKQFRSEISNGDIAVGKESPLADIFSRIINDTEENEVSFLITDAIMSGSNKDIANNREYNYVHRAELRQEIRETFQQARKKNLSVLVYRFECPFKGIYYDYKNAHKEISVSNRPYFIFAFGNQQQLNIVMENARKEPDFRPDDMMFVGQNYKTVDTYKIKAIKGSEYTPNNVGKAIEYKSVATHDAEIGINVNLGNLPSYMQKIEFIKNNLRLTTIDTSTKKEIDCTNFLDDVEETDSKTKEFIFRLLIDKNFLLNLPQAITLRIGSEQDSWYKTYSLEKDDDILANDNKTFSLDYLIEGILLGMETEKLPDILNIKLNIKK